MRTVFDVIIAGGGPAGSACAWFAAQAGLRVLLLDAARFPRDKVCGDVLTRTKALSVLSEMGVWQDVVGRLPGASCESGLLIGSDGTSLEIPPPCSVEPWRRVNRVCPRKLLDQRLISQAASVTTVLEGVRVTGVERQHDALMRVTGQDQRSGVKHAWLGRVVVGAEGVRSSVADAMRGRRPPRAQIGLAVRGYFTGIAGVTNRLELFCFDHLRPGYVWLFPCGDGTANVGLYLLKDTMKRQASDGLVPLFWNHVNTHPLLAERFRNAAPIGPFVGAPLPLWAGRQPLSGDGIVLVGDAAALVDPVTGDGIGNALLSGKLAGEAIATVLDDGPAEAHALSRYDQQLWSVIGHELKLARTFLWLQRQSGFTESIIRLAHRFSVVRQLVRAVVAGPDGKQELLSPAGLWQSLRAHAPHRWNEVLDHAS